jgi:uncharacterized protein YraI
MEAGRPVSVRPSEEISMESPVAYTNVKFVLVLVAGLVLPSSAFAALGFATGNVNMRTGPSTGYRVIVTIPRGASVRIYGCVRGFRWCDVRWGGWRGWVSSRYLSSRGYYGRPPSIWGPVIGVPIIRFHFDRYHDRHYRGKKWYKKPRRRLLRR